MELFKNYKQKYKELQIRYEEASKNHDEEATRLRNGYNNREKFFFEIVEQRNAAEKNELKIREKLEAIKIELEQTRKYSQKEHEKLVETKAVLKSLKSNYTSVLKKNEKLNRQNEILQMKSKYADGILERFKQPKPTIQELIEYNRTHKSPRKKEGIAR